MTDRAAPRTEAGKRLAKLLARDYDEDFLSPDWTHPSEMILAIEREAAAAPDRAAPRTEAPNEQHVMPDWQEHKTASDCWCQPIYEDEPPNGRLWIHRAAHDEPHRRND